MKKTIISIGLCLLVSNFCSVYGQLGKDKNQQHTGFYLSMSVGPAFGTIFDEMKGAHTEKLDFKGTGALFDVKIGAAIKENIILHATMASTSLSDAKVTSNKQGIGKTNDVSINENMMIGAGLTYYIMPSNVFLSGSLGIGNYSVTNSKNSDNAVKTDNGFSMQLKVGKEWWLGRRWGLGAALTYGKTVVTNGPYGGTEEKLNSNRIGILFNATFN